ncbi:MerR family transcriptional regulator [Patescibacteria group bacterium]|nr:MerR family transcriptional regulator [Patescibacteria group bacterium]MBU1682551.1 MerR family transcriptional regulator [Patescibacteria group bacterium]
MEIDQKLLSIGEASILIGVSADTLREWDKKGVLNSFRPLPTSKRYYRKEDINSFLKRDKPIDLIDIAKKWVSSEPPIELPSSLYCETSDIFSARLQHFSIEIENIADIKDIFPLIIAITGEIGNNSYNHNIGNWPDVPGTFFGYDIKKQEIVLADRGQGIFKTLKRVLPKLKNDQEALKVAFTEYITGRAPEDRGNGLKFVRDIVTQNPLHLEFQTGNAILELKKDDQELNIKKTNTSLRGCIAIIKY